MNGSADRHQDQVAYWNTRGGEKWIAAQAHTDIMLEPIQRVLLEHARLQPGMAVLEIGCGCGATTLELAKAAGAEGRVLAVDVSQPMLDFAKGRLAPYRQAELLCADASVHPFSPFADLAISRFGVMFFGDPAGAFANIRKAFRPGARLVFACWRKLEDNAWMQVPLHAAYNAGVPRMPRPEPEDPGPFSFADPDRVTRILTAAGFETPHFSKADLSLDIAAGEGLASAVQQSVTVGATSRALQDQPDSLRTAAIKAIETALMPYLQNQSVFLAAAIWIVESSAV